MLISKRKTVAKGAAAMLSAGMFVCMASAVASTPDVVAQMKQFIEENSQKPSFTPPGPPLDASKLKGKTIAIQMIDGRIGAIRDVADAVQVAAERAGLKTTVFDAKSSPVRMQQGFQEAINSGADAIVN
ncbi:MAG TPA: sugar ABC transporter substrate-binding protein, partial [Pusillimonas sp.]|nr:sugar ABC transporter substrate-binding protein [Pusillimonas sp.]